MKSFLLVVVAFVALFLVSMLADSAKAHGGADVRVLRNGAVVVNGRVVNRGFHNVGPRDFRGNRSFFNQDGGRNRFGFRR